MLPEKINGQFWLGSEEGSRNAVSIEGINDQWIINSNNDVRLIDANGGSLRSAVVQPDRVYNLFERTTGEKFFVYSENTTRDRAKFTKLLIADNSDITIGRKEENGIVYRNGLVSSTHATLSYRNKKWFIVDNNSGNGVFVNGVRVGKANLSLGDCVYIMGLKMIIGNVFIACNNPGGCVFVNSDKISRFVPQMPELRDEYEKDIPQEFFYRSPRFKREIEKAKFRIDDPPQNQIGDEMPVALVLGPSITMGAASLGTAAFSVSTAMSNGNMTSAVPSMIMAGSMLLGSVMWPVLSKRYEKKHKREKEATRQTKYSKYLSDMSAKFDKECRRQEGILRENIITVDECISRIESVKRNLWERSPGQDDFLRLRLGIGTGELAAEVAHSEEKFTMEDDNLKDEMRKLCDSPKILKDIPISVSFFDNFVAGIIGQHKMVAEFAKGLIFQIAALYSYDEVKMVFIYNPSDEKEFGFCKWLPHAWNDDKTFRYIATNANELKEISVRLESEFDYRKELNDSDLEDVSPYYVIFSLDRRLGVQSELIKKIGSHKENVKFSVINCYDALNYLPKECTSVIELDVDSGKVSNMGDITGKYTWFKPDINVRADPMTLSKKIANINLYSKDNLSLLPDMVTFLELYGVGKVEHLNVLSRWKENDPTKTLSAPVGVTTTGDKFVLDLHQKFHGPHGLIAGMTGSGKSEFIMTYILSLAVNYHPDEVAFILIDYKGGGMADSFKDLPHVAGIITNLDGAAIRRSLTSIQSELLRRQALFAEAGKKLNESNMDIYKYQKLYRSGKVREPLPHLLIISDEFAELKTQQSEFMTQLVSAARIGRSLGVHLILATQKPSGVVDDQIWSNSRFKVCLKVQERSDSMDMLKRPDAAELTQTGRFYLQVGYNELFEIGQSAWSGAPYYPANRLEKEVDNSVTVIDRTGTPLVKYKIDKKAQQFSNPQKQLDAITLHIKEIADREHISVRKLWLDPIAEQIYLDDLYKKYSVSISSSSALNPIIGEYDDPENQRQCLLTIPITSEGNLVIYGIAGSGKASFLTVMIYSLIHEHTPDEVNLYILDFSAETLRAFAKAPHVGDVILSNEAEKVGNMFKLIKQALDMRKRLFSNYGGDITSYIESTGKKIPSIVVVINNFAAFSELYEERVDAVSYLLREGVKYGIYFVVTAVGTSDVGFRMTQNFKQQLVLQLNDDSDYSIVVGKTEGLFPHRNKGRGLIRIDKKLFEFQTAFVVRDEKQQYKAIVSECDKLAAAWNGNRAKRIPILPDDVDVEFLSAYVTPHSIRLPVGVDRASLQVSFYPFGDYFITPVMADNDSLCRSFGASLAKMIGSYSDIDTTFIDMTDSFQEYLENGVEYHGSKDNMNDFISNLFQLVVARFQEHKQAIEKGENPKSFEEKLIIINGFEAFTSYLTGKSPEMLSLIFANGQGISLHFILLDPVRNFKGIQIKNDEWYQAYKAKISGSDGIWLGSGIRNQYVLNSNASADVSDEFGYLVVNGKVISCAKMLNELKESADYE